MTNDTNAAIMDTMAGMSMDAGYHSDTWPDLSGEALSRGSDIVRWLLEPIPPALVLAQVAAHAGCNVPDVLRIACSALECDKH